MKKKIGEKTERKGSIVKCGETPFKGYSFYVWWSYRNCLHQKVGPSLDVRLARKGWYTGSKVASGYCYHCCVFGATMCCIAVCLEKRRGDSGVKQVLRICLVEAMRWKCGDGAAGSCWWTVVAGWYFLVVPVWKSLGDELTGEVELGEWVDKAGKWWPWSPYGSRIGYLPCLNGLSLGSRGDHITSQLSWIAA